MKRHSVLTSGILAAGLLLAACPVRADDIYVTRSDNTITIIDPVTKTESFFWGTNTLGWPGGNGAGSGGLNSPTGIGFDSSGDLFVVNKGDDSIMKIDRAGVMTTFVSSAYGSTLLNDPQALTVDSAGNVYVANYGTNSIAKFTGVNSGGILAFSVAGSLVGPVGLAIGPDGLLYTTTSDDTIKRLDTTTGAIQLYSNAAPGTIFLNGLGFSPAGKLYVTSSYAGAIPNAITIYEGTPPAIAYTTFATHGTTGPGMINPLGPAFDANGNLFITNTTGVTDPNDPQSQNNTTMWYSADGSSNTIISVTPTSIPNFLALGPTAIPEPSVMLEGGLMLLFGGTLVGWRRRAARRVA